MRRAFGAAAPLLLFLPACGDDTTLADGSDGPPARLTVVADLHHRGAFVEGALAILRVVDDNGVEVYSGATEHLQGAVGEGLDRSYPVATNLAVRPGSVTIELEIRSCTMACPDPSKAETLTSSGPDSICTVEVDVDATPSTTAVLYAAEGDSFSDCELRSEPVPWVEG